MIHATAAIHPKAELDETVEVGPYAVIDGEVRLGPNCVVGPHVYLTGNLEAGGHNTFFASCVIGEAPQDLKYRGAPTGVTIGDQNVFREYVTVHRSNTPEVPTAIGSHNFLMANSHVGHNCRLADHVILANSALLAGHVTVEDGVFISGNAVVHQFVRLGRLALLQGLAGIGKDLPPFTMASHVNSLSGLNTVGLRRAGIGSEVRLELRRLYHVLFRRRRAWKEALDEASQIARSEEGRYLVDFVSSSKRGVLQDVKFGQRTDESSPSATETETE